MMALRAAGVVFVIALLLPHGAAAQRTWYAAYEEGLRAIEQEDWTTAEARLKQALLIRPAQGRRVLWYGTRREDYIAEYHLAVVYANTGRHQQALDLFAKVERAKLVVPGSPEYGQLARLTESAKNAIAAPQIASGRPVSPPEGDAAPVPSRGTPQGPVPPSAPGAGEATAAAAARAETERRDRFITLVMEASGDLAGGRLESARSRAEEARSIGVDDGKAAELLRRVDVAMAERDLQTSIRRLDWREAQRLRNVLRDLEPRHVRLQEFDAAISKGLAQAPVADLERSALRAFYVGDYAMTILLLERSTQNRASPRALFYLACSHAAIGLLDGPRGSLRLQQARVLYAKARPGQNRFALDRQYISPRILQALETP